MRSETVTEGDRPLLLSAIPARPDQVRQAIILIVGLLGVLAIASPFARVPLTNTEALLPAYAAAIFVNESITSALLLALFSVERSRAVLILAAGYLFSGFTVIPWALTFPGVFPAWGINEGLQTTAAIAALRRLGYPLFVLGYALMRDREPVRGSSRWSIISTVTGVASLAVGATWLIIVGDDLLPALMRDERNPASFWFLVPPTAILLYFICLVTLFARRRSILDIWLIVVVCTLLIEIVLLSYVSAGTRLNVGWWAGRLCGLVSASIVLLVLLSETTKIYARLVRSVAAERRTRANRLTAMEALSASIAHEIKQPLASMVTNADAGSRWLAKDNPQLEEAKAAFGRIVRDGHHASRVIESIRTMFTKGAQERVLLNLNSRIEEVVKASEGELRLAGFSLEVDLEAELPLVIGNPAQLQQVVSNLVDNGIEAMRLVTGRRRVLRVTSRRQDGGEVLVSVEDTGTGLDPAHKDDIFAPFFTTKPDGMGMGLMFCRSAVEAHGGRLWASANVPHGATFRFSLPEAAEAT